MSYILSLVIFAVVAFLLGSFPSGVVIGRVFFGADPRDGGSGSIGTTNMARTLGWKAAIITFILDVAKGALAVAVVRLVIPYVAIDAQWQIDFALLFAALLSILGHVFSPWLGFKGGKGIATGLGSLLVAIPPVAALILGVFIILVAITRTVSIGSIAAATTLPIFACIFYWGSVPIISFSLAIAVAVDFAHRGNIKRIIAGEEPKFSIGGKDKDSSDE